MTASVLLRGSVPPCGASHALWGALQDSNLRPADYESAALTAELRAQVAFQEGLEPPTGGLEGRCSILLSYWNAWREHPDSNRGSRFCRPLPYRLAMPPTFRASMIADARSSRKMVSPPSWGAKRLRRRAARHMAGAAGIEPAPAVLETAVLPLNYAPKVWWSERDSNPRRANAR